MKLQSIKHTLSFTVLVACLFLIACGNDDPTEATPAEQVSALLVASEWRMQSVQVDGIDKSDVYSGLTLQFTANGFTSAAGQAIWPASGTWNFTDDAATKFKRDDGLEITISSITATQLDLELSWTETTLGSGRVSSVGGKHRFVFIK